MTNLTLPHHLVRRLGGTGPETRDFDQLFFQSSGGLRRPYLSGQNRMHGVEVSFRDFLIFATGGDRGPGDYTTRHIRSCGRGERFGNRRRIRELNLHTATSTAVLFAFLHERAKLETEQCDRFLAVTRVLGHGRTGAS